MQGCLSISGLFEKDPEDRPIRPDILPVILLALQAATYRDNVIAPLCRKLPLPQDFHQLAPNRGGKAINAAKQSRCQLAGEFRDLLMSQPDLYQPDQGFVTTDHDAGVLYQLHMMGSLRLIKP